jgi:hypothetical protein
VPSLKSWYFAAGFMWHKGSDLWHSGLLHSTSSLLYSQGPPSVTSMCPLNPIHALTSYFSKQITEDKMCEACDIHVADEKWIYSFSGETYGRRPLRRPRHRWEDITIDIKEIGWEGMDFIHLAQERDKVSICCEHSIESPRSIKCAEFLE